jgi:hypothetical protein
VAEAPKVERKAASFHVQALHLLAEDLTHDLQISVGEFNRGQA